MKWDTMRRNNLGIWKNIGKIVILLFQIVYEQVKWYVHSWSPTKIPKSMEALHNMSIPHNKKIEKNNDRTTRSNIKTKDDITFI